MKEITIIIPTFKRLDGLKRVINSIKNNISINYDLLVMIDNNDKDSYFFCCDNNINCILVNTHNDFVKQMNIGIMSSETPYILKLDDDMEIINDCLTNGLNVYKEKFNDNDGLLCFNDGISHGSVFTAGIFTKKLIYKLNGYLYYPLYKHFGGDRELVNFCKKIDRYYYDSNIIIKHYHWQSDSSVLKDETYDVSINKFWKQDQILKKDRQRDENIFNKFNYCDYL